MSVKRLFAVIAIFIAATVAWMILSGATQYRTQTNYDRLSEGVSEEGNGRATVQQLWGQPQSQVAPEVRTTHKERQKRLNAKGKAFYEEVDVTDSVDITGSRLKVNINLEPRRKGLLWYSTYGVKFSGDYDFKNTFSNERKFTVRFVFPAGQAVYDNVVAQVNSKRVYPSGDLSQGLVARITLPPGGRATFSISYGSQGLDA